MKRSPLVIPGLHLRHLVILGFCFYLFQAIATADGAFKLNHDLFFAVRDRGYQGVMKSLTWLNVVSDRFDRWTADQFGKDPWTIQGDLLSRYTRDCVSTPVPGFATKAKINRYIKSKQKDLRILGRPLCRSVSGNFRWLIDDANKVFEVNPSNLSEYGLVDIDKANSQRAVQRNFEDANSKAENSWSAE